MPFLFLAMLQHKKGVQKFSDRGRYYCAVSLTSQTLFPHEINKSLPLKRLTVK